MTLKPYEVKTVNIATKAVTEEKIGDKAIEARHIAEGAVTPDKLTITPVSRPLTPGLDTAEIKDAAVTSTKIAPNAVTTDHIAADAVATDDIKDGAVTRDKIRDGAVTKEKMADGTIGTAEIIDGAITAPKLGTNSVTSAKIAAGAVKTGEIADAAITPAKLSFAIPTRPLVPPIVAAEIATDAVETAKIKNQAVTNDKLAMNSVETEKIKDGEVTPAKASVGFGRYVPRPAAVWDLQSANFTRDGNWHVDGMDLSSIVPVGAIAIALQIEYAQTTSDSYLIFRQNDTKLPIRLNNQVGIQINSFNVIMPIDADRLIDYAVNDSLDVVIGVAVLGWWI